jgi:hypothetical protein
VIDRLLYEIDGTGLHRLHRHRHIGVSADHDQRQADAVRAQALGSSSPSISIVTPKRRSVGGVSRIASSGRDRDRSG